MAIVLDLNKNAIFYNGLYGVISKAFENSATLAASVYETFDETTSTFSNVVTGADGLTMTYVTSSNGVYYAVLAETINWVPNTQTYYAVVQGTGDWAHFVRSKKFKVRNP